MSENPAPESQDISNYPPRPWPFPEERKHDADAGKPNPTVSSLETWIRTMSTAALNLDSGETGLVQRVCAGDKQAFYQLVQPYERVIFSTAMSVLRNEADAEEVSQEAVLKAFCALPHFRGECRFSTWLIQITINEARARLRKERRSLYESIDELRIDQDGNCFSKDYTDWREMPSEEFQRKELRRALQSAMESLAPSYQKVLVLRHLGLLTTQKTAELLGLTKGCVKVRLLRARLQMRDALEPEIDGSWTTGRVEFENETDRRPRACDGRWTRKIRASCLQ
jgi:RNA polymerase sigma-70 factor, ECF subfamily